MTKLKEKICLFFFTITFFFSFNSAIFAETIQFEPTKLYGVQSAPQPSIATTQPVNSAQVDTAFHSQNSRSLVEQLTALANTLGDIGYEVFTFLVSVLVGTILVLSYFGAWMIRTAYSMISGNISYYKENGWILAGLLLLAPALGMFGLVSRPFLSGIKTLFKSTIDMQARFILWLSAFGGAILAGTSTKVIYDKYKQNFEQKTGWKLGAFNHDAMWVGGFILLAGVFIGGQTIAVGVEAGTISTKGLTEGIKDTVVYMVKETKSAFTETEKECEVKSAGCENLFNKMVILGFNYLPGNMPDLNLDEGVIRLKELLMEDEENVQASTN